MLEALCEVFKKIMENRSEPLPAQPNLVMQHVGFTRHVGTPPIRVGCHAIICNISFLINARYFANGS